jgi:imidazolonepropionase-like amidohydrolase
MADVNRSRLKCHSPARSRAFNVIFFAFIAAAAAIIINAAASRADAPDVYAIRDAQIVTGTGRVISKGTVVFRNGLITDVGETVRIPADARVINGAGMTVYPGLIDAYTSLGLQAPATQQQRQGGAGAGPAAIPAALAQQPSPEASLGDPSLAAADQVRPGGTSIEDARSAGVTAALSSPRQGIIPGQSALINLAGEEPSKFIVRTPVAMTVQFSTSAGFFGQYPNSLMGTVAFIRQSFYDAANYRDQVDRYNRVKRGVQRPEYDKKLAALQPALRGEMPVIFIAQTDGDIRRALMISDEFKLRPIIAGALYGYRVADLLKAKNVPVILSLDFPRRAADLPDDEDEPLRVLRARAEVPKGAARLAQSGVKFAFTSGTLRPQDFIANAQKAVEQGLPKDEALRALTINAAEILGAGDQLGTIETGKIANLVVTSGDLFARETRVRHVFIDGNEIELRRPETPTAQRGGPGGRPGGAGAQTGGAADPSGEWALVVRTPQGDQNARLVLRREGEQINGSLATSTGTNDIRNARLTGNELRFTTSVQLGADTMEASVTATIEGGTMRGTIALPALGTFEFTGTRPR